MSILTSIKSTFSNDLYIQAWEKRLKITNVTSHETFDEEPLVALQNDKRGRPVVVAVGNAVKNLVNAHQYVISNPFSHPRLLVNDFQVAEKVLAYGVKQVHKNRRLPPSPRVVFQPMEKLEGGVTTIEERLYRELCLGAGARQVLLHTGNELSVYNLDFDQFKSR